AGRVRARGQPRPGRAGPDARGLRAVRHPAARRCRVHEAVPAGIRDAAAQMVRGRGAGHAYPWDVLEDCSFPSRVRGHGLRTVTLAASYHSTRAATPLHPLGPRWLDAADPFGSAAATLRAAGLKVRTQVLAAVREHAPGVPVTLHGHPDPWATGASPGLTPTAAADVDAVLVPCWPVAQATADMVARPPPPAPPPPPFFPLCPPPPP